MKNLQNLYRGSLRFTKETVRTKQFAVRLVSRTRQNAVLLFLVLQATTLNLFAQAPPHTPGTMPNCMKTNNLFMHTGVNWNETPIIPTWPNQQDKYWEITSTNTGGTNMCAYALWFYEPSGWFTPPNAGRLGRAITSATSGTLCPTNASTVTCNLTSNYYPFRRSFWVDIPAGTTAPCLLNMQVIADDRLDRVLFNGAILLGVNTPCLFPGNVNGFAIPVMVTSGLNIIDFDILNRDNNALSTMALDVQMDIISTTASSIFVRNDYYIPITNILPWSCFGGQNTYLREPNLTDICVPAPNTQGEIQISNFDPNFFYNIFPQNAPPNSTGGFQGVVGNTYTVVATDSKNCFFTATATMTSTSMPPVVSLSPNHLCLPIPSVFHTITATASSGFSPYSYSISPVTSIISNNAFVNTAGAYTVKVTDAHGCTGTSIANVGNRFDVVLGTNNNCMNQGGGLSQIVASTNPVLPGIQYSIDGINFSTNNTFNVTSVGVYTITAIDPYQCSYTNTIEIFPNPIPIIISNNLDCFPTYTATSPSTISPIVASGWADPYNNVSWATTPASPNHTPNYQYPTPPPITYTVTAFDANGCSGTTTQTYEANPFCCSYSQNSNVIGYEFSSNTTLNNYTATDIIAEFGTNNITTAGTINFDGTIIIDQPITFTNCQLIKLTKNTKIVVTQGNSLTFDNCNLRAKCDEMWKGIYGDIGTEIVLKDSWIMEMEEGVVVSNGGIINATGNTFYENYISMQIVNAPFGYNAVNGNCIILNNTFTDGGANLLAPYSSQVRPEIGIKIINSKEVQIGALGGSNTGNHFYMMYNGIYILPGSVTQTENYHIYNNTFWRIKNYPYLNSNLNELYYKVLYWAGNDHRGAAIFCKPGTNTPNPTHTLHLKADLETQNFKWCDRAVILHSTSASIDHITVSSCLMGFMFAKANNQKYNIHGNAIAGNYYAGSGFLDYTLVGMRFHGNPAMGNVFNNQIDLGPYWGVNMQQNQKVYPVGIDLDFNDPSGSQLMLIKDNYLTLSLASGIGISLRNTGSGTDILRNTINNYGVAAFGDPNYISAGISVENAFKSKIRGNQIHGNSDLLLNQNPYDGIRMNASTQCLLECNETYSTRRGLRVYSNCTTGFDQVHGNTFDTHGYAMEFNDLGTQGTLGQIGSPNYDCRNNFYNSALFAPNTYGIYRNVTIPFFGDEIHTTYCPSTYSWSDQPGGASRYNILTNPGVPNYVCPQTVYQMMASPQQNASNIMSIQQALDIALDSVEYSEYEETVSWMEKQRLFTALSGPDSIMLSNTELAQFYNNQLLHYSDELLLVNRLFSTLSDSTVYEYSTIYALRLQEIETINNSIGGNNSLEINEKLMNQYTLQWLRGELDSLSSSDSASIENMANSCPFVNGYGVYKARVLMHAFGNYSNLSDKYLCNAVGMYKNGSGEDDPEINSALILNQKDAEIRLSPNPFDNKLTIEYKLESGEEAIFILYDLVGKEVYRTGIESSTNKATLSIPELTKGVYLFRYSTKKGKVNYSGKLIKE